MSRLLLAACALVLAACSTLPSAVPENPALELTAVPFFPQTAHQCGPAALATVLGATGVAVTPEELAPQVYVPGRKGSFAVELASAARRAGRLPWVLPADDPAAIFREVDAGHPVLLLQDLGAAGIRWWHYAVVVGTGAGGDVVVLRSGRERRHLLGRDRFLRSWEQGGRWAMVALPPGSLPATLPPAAIVAALEDARGQLRPDDVAATYAAAAARWPADAGLAFAVANDAWTRGDLPGAERHFRAALAADPGHVPARNNLATLWLARGCPAAAAALMAGMPPDTGPFAAAVADTRRRIDQGLAAAGPPADCADAAVGVPSAPP